MIRRSIFDGYLRNHVKRVLLVDTDPQGSLTASLGYVEPDEIPVTLAKYIISSDQ